MNIYEEYLEKIIELREQEIDIYKDFIEKELRCKIKEEIRSELEFDNNGRPVKEVHFKIITIPESKYFARIDP
jgi:hypothetical protein